MYRKQWLVRILLPVYRLIMSVGRAICPPHSPSSHYGTAPYLAHLWVFSFQIPGGRDHSLDSPHAEVVMVLGAELLRGTA